MFSTVVVCSQLNIKDEHEDQTYLQPPPQHMLRVIPVVPERCFLSRLEPFLLSQGREYSSHSASLPPDVCSACQHTPLCHSPPPHWQQVAAPLLFLGRLAALGRLGLFLVKTKGSIQSAHILSEYILSLLVCVWGVCEVGAAIKRSSLTLYFLLLSKGGSQRLTGGAKHPVLSGVAVPDAEPSVSEVLDPVSGQGQLRSIVTVTWAGFPVEVTEGALEHAQEAIQVTNHKLWWIHRWVPQDPRDNVSCSSHARLFVSFCGRI